MLGAEEDALSVAVPLQGLAGEGPLAPPAVVLAAERVDVARAVAHPQVKPRAEEGALRLRVELQEELATGAHDRGGELAQAAEGPDQRRELVDAVVDLDIVAILAVIRQGPAS